MNKAHAIIENIINQRNNALNECASLLAELAEAKEKIKELQTLQIADCKINESAGLKKD